MSPTIRQSLSALLSAFPATDSADPESAALAFMMAVDDIDPAFVAAAVKGFIKGKVKRDRHTFLPSTAELAVEARRLQRQAEVDALIASRHALPKPDSDSRPPVSAEDRQKVGELMRSLAKKLTPQKHEAHGLSAEEELAAMASQPVRASAVLVDKIASWGSA